MKKRNLFRLAVAFLGISLTSLYCAAGAALPTLNETPPLARVFGFDPGLGHDSVLSQEQRRRSH